ncbi:MAG: hypothetical protein GTN80_03105 [Nitrososphaeria archaeon]|nr:hypothetical protein [Nitrososphaeria archaeon]NIN52168.1 hypothetical protein [Nitrososphaeria archaeon]NIQ32621.1 hypothetical protein [Nitrososphaeria archaeon]
MSLEFGFALATMGIASVFSAMTIIIIISLILKVKYKEGVSLTPPSETPKEILMERERLAAVAAAVAVYLDKSTKAPPRYPKHVRRLQPMMWSMAGRIDLMNMRVQSRGVGWCYPSR